jgi:hypothetical protein
MSSFLGRVVSVLALVLVVSSSIPIFTVQGATLSCKSFNRNDFPNPTRIYNKYLPMKPGTTLLFEGTKGSSLQRNEFSITHKTKTIQGVTTVEIKDTVKRNGTLAEVALDWFAQDKFGNVWYFGEFVTEYENGVPVSHEGSWQAGVDGAKPGIVMKAHPRVGDFYCQEVAPGVAEDQAQILSLDKERCVPKGCFDDVLLTKETSPLIPGVVENKYYAPGIGLIEAVRVQGGSESLKLVQIVLPINSDGSSHHDCSCSANRERCNVPEPGILKHCDCSRIHVV